jgi:DNA polymerase-3 subunit beta
LFVENAQGWQWSLQTVSPDGWPTVLAGGEGAPAFRIPCDQFARCVLCVLPAASNDSPRLAGVHIETRDEKDAEDKVVHFTATDGRRLYTTAAWFEQDINDAAFLVPAAIMRTVAAAAAHGAARGDDAIQVCVSTSSATFAVGDLVIRAGLIDSASFPQWRRAIPSRPSQPTVVSAADMLAATRQAAIVTSEESRAVLFTFGNEVVLRSESADYGDSSCAVKPAEVGIKTSVSLDPRFVCDFLSHVVTLDSGSMVAFDVASPRDAVVLTHDDATAVLMPISGGGE